MIRAALPTSRAASGAGAATGPRLAPAGQGIFRYPAGHAGSTAAISERFSPCEIRVSISVLEAHNAHFRTRFRV